MVESCMDGIGCLLQSGHGEASTATKEVAQTAFCAFNDTVALFSLIRFEAVLGSPTRV